MDNEVQFVLVLVGGTEWSRFEKQIAVVRFPAGAHHEPTRVGQSPRRMRGCHPAFAVAGEEFEVGTLREQLQPLPQRLADRKFTAVVQRWRVSVRHRDGDEILEHFLQPFLESDGQLHVITARHIQDAQEIDQRHPMITWRQLDLGAVGIDLRFLRLHGARAGRPQPGGRLLELRQHDRQMHQPRPLHRAPIAPDAKRPRVHQVARVLVKRPQHPELRLNIERWRVLEVAIGWPPRLRHADAGIKREWGATPFEKRPFEKTRADAHRHRLNPTVQLFHEFARIFLVFGRRIRTTQRHPMEMPVERNGPLVIVMRVFVPLNPALQLGRRTTCEPEDMVANLVRRADPAGAAVG